MCAGAAAARSANKSAKRNYKYRLEVRRRRHIQKLNRYALARVQYRSSIDNINEGLARSYSRAQTKLNLMKGKAWRTNQDAMIKAMSQSAYAKALSAGKKGKSIERLKTMEAGALGRFYAQQARGLTLAKDAFVLGTKADRRKARVAQESAFAKVWLTPKEDAAPPAHEMQNVGMAMFGDVMGFAKTAVSLGVGAPPGLDSAGGLFNTGFLAGSGG